MNDDRSPARACDFWDESEFMPIEEHELRRQGRCVQHEPNNPNSGHGYSFMHCGFARPCPLHEHPSITPRDRACHMETCKGKYCGFAYSALLTPIETVVPPRCQCRREDVVPAFERDPCLTPVSAFFDDSLPLTSPIDNVYLRCGICGKRRDRSLY